VAKKRITIKKNQPQPETQVTLFEGTEFGNVENKKYTKEQAEFIEFKEDKSIILAATAGSGKTASCVGRLKELLKRGVDPSRIIFFSFTRAATEELIKRIGNKDIVVTTIHSFCMGVLAKCGKFKQIATFYQFVEWFRDKYKPSPSADQATKNFYYETIGTLYDEADYLASAIAAFKLQSADGIKSKVPAYISEYNLFLREKRARDFSDMLIEVRDLFREDKYLKQFRGKYDYIFVDEYQDTSTIQLQVLLALNANHYYLIGDRYQSIYSYSGANCSKLEEMIKNRRETIEMSLSVNFRSDQNIVKNSNQFSGLKATANSQEDGFVDNKLMLTIDELIEVLQLPEEVAVLVRTNDVIKKLEIILLKRKIPIKYTNYITSSDVKSFHAGEINQALKTKLNMFKHDFETPNDLIHFIEMHKKSNKFITTIHKSKGREFDTTVIVNSIPPYLLDANPGASNLTKKQREKLTFDPSDEDDVEPRNIHYVAVSRAKHKIYFMALLF
jgi:superfamily I DNA/RNA helicase